MGTSKTNAKGIARILDEKYQFSFHFQGTNCQLPNKPHSQISKRTQHVYLSKIQDFMAKSTGARSVPRIFIGGQFVGGCDELMKLKSSGKLGQLISSARSG